ncbi:MAG: pyridoxine 5'-phosphate synthase [Betaproteobacteria bacterium TMED156]|nr:MAG: pyridoxine 5'-phosphate synthase [Betaproteobacteria bacterium TMED156]|tara:strand:+ start:906 stop:1655 length:750 start_codon:yes stop_codon:yes gene_type:complete
MIKLGVNIDHVATLRQARLTYEPDPVWAAVEAHLGGADGITVHLREDRRHIQDTDVERLRTHTQIKLNLEMAATDEMIDLALTICPEMVMLVPEGRKEITTEGGLDVVKGRSTISNMIKKLNEKNITVSAFVDADPEQILASKDCGVEVCEVHTGPYAHVFHKKGRDQYSNEVQNELKKLANSGDYINKLNMKFNAGHALNYFNVEPVAALANIRELHIGHAIISRSIFVGIREAVREMKRLIRETVVK